MSHVLLTGVTGFVGKVVLEELLRRRDELGVERVTLMIRAGKTRDGKPIDPAERFRKSVASAELFAGLPAGWEASVDVAACDLEQPRCGLSDADFDRVAAKVTHVIHCAASVEFDLPIKDAAAANITTALEVLELARACRKLVGLVDVSTAYVSAWRPGAIHEQLAHLPRPAADTYKEIVDGTRTEAELLAETGHPNTYTFTKCITEHLVSQRRGEVPVIIVRPSIVSASWKAPFPGWLDSPAALAGCLLYTGLGVVRAWKADPATRLDVVPVDIVSQRIVEAAFQSTFPKPGQPVPIRYAAMGIEHALRVDMAAGSTIEFFRQRPGAKAVPGMFIGRSDHGFAAADLMRRELPTQMKRALLSATNRSRDKRRLEKADEKVRYLNSAFEYFTHHTFDFQAAQPVDAAGFDPIAYMDVVNRGLYKHLLRFDDTEMTLAGAAHDDARDDMAWVREHPEGGMVMRTLGVGVRKAMRRCASKITFDRPSFERAMDEAPPDTLFVLAPSPAATSTSCSPATCASQHPELGIPVPHIAAAEEFGKIPLVGRVLRESRAFYIKRGAGREMPELSDELRRLADKHASMMFFVEGQRSRSRHFLPPKRGMLRGLQATERTFTLLPISMAYDRSARGGVLRARALGRSPLEDVLALAAGVDHPARARSGPARPHAHRVWAAAGAGAVDRRPGPGPRAGRRAAAPHGGVDLPPPRAARRGQPRVPGGRRRRRGVAGRGHPPPRRPGGRQRSRGAAADARGARPVAAQPVDVLVLRRRGGAAPEQPGDRRPRRAQHLDGAAAADGARRSAGRRAGGRADGAHRARLPHHRDPPGRRRRAAALPGRARADPGVPDRTPPAPRGRLRRPRRPRHPGRHRGRRLHLGPQRPRRRRVLRARRRPLERRRAPRHARSMKMKPKVLVTGATGYLGRHLLGAMHQQGVPAAALVRKPREWPQVEWQPEVGDVELVEGTPLDPQAWQGHPSVADVGTIIHAAGIVRHTRAEPEEMLHVNVEGTLQMIRAGKALGARVVLVSSSGTVACYRHLDLAADEHAPFADSVSGRWPYYASKIRAEREGRRLADKLGVELVIVRLPVLLGPLDHRLRSTGHVTRVLENRVPFIPSGGMHFTDIRDVAAAMTRMTQLEKVRGIYNFPGTQSSLATFFRMVCEVSGATITDRRAPAWLLGGVAAATETITRSTKL
ncbi:MAG: SDR family oxidoreductase, partial [Kofleriaceae bacterium]